MTKLFSIIAVAIIATTVVSCGPSAEEKAKIEREKNETRLLEQKPNESNREKKKEEITYQCMLNIIRV